MSEDDQHRLKACATIIPNGVDLARFTPEIERPGSRLLFKTGAGTDADQRIHDLAARHGMERDRVTIVGRTATRDDYLKLYHAVDICLDPFPYNGITTTCGLENDLIVLIEQLLFIVRSLAVPRHQHLGQDRGIYGLLRVPYSAGRSSPRFVMKKPS